MGKKKSNFRKGFRKNKRVNHPAYLIGENGGEYDYIGITHSETVNEEANIPLKKNPNPQDPKRAYLRPSVESDKPTNFGRAYKGWGFSEEDKKTVRELIENAKKKPRK